MSMILIVSVVIRLIALGWALHLYNRFRDWRFGFLGAMIALMALRQTLTLAKKGFIWPPSFTTNIDEMPGLAVSVLALLTLIFLGRMITEERNKRAEIRATNQELERQIERRQQIEKRIRTLSQVVEQSPVSVIITDTDARIEYVNQAFEQATGYSAQEVVGRNPGMFKSGLTPKLRYKELWRSLNEGRAWKGEFQNRRKDGELFWESAHISPVLDSDGRVSNFLALKVDITQQKHQEEQILRQALYDNLTQLPNRFLVLDRLTQQINEYQRSGKKIALIFLDLDDFKKINDSLGHEVGDKLLVQAAVRLSNTVRAVDTVGRLGGDEFVVLLSGLESAAGARPVAENLLERFRDPFPLDGRELVLTASLGIAVYPDDGQNPAELLRSADTAMYHSKGEGRNTYHYFTETMNRDVSRRLLLEEQLHGALGKGELRLCYQPLVKLESRSVIGLEALLRWNNPVLGEVSPAEFIPIAEQIGLIVPIGQFVIREALKRAANWQKSYGSTLKISVNLSPRQLYDPGLLDHVATELKRSGLARETLALEVTEGVLINSHPQVDAALVALSNLGVQLAMDDFGTGYSSLSYLRNYPFDVLKIDRSFVNHLTGNQADRELVKAIIVMAHVIGLQVVAEGIETEEQLDFLSEQGCDLAQGYLFSRPVEEMAVGKMLNEMIADPV